MKVSVLIPVYNGGQYLAECMESVLAQDFADLEILVSDDGSQDKSLEIISQFAAHDSRIRWWKNPRNLGMIGNFNACLQEARGDYIQFVLQDDKLLSHSAIRKLAAALNEHPSAVLAGSRQHLTGTSSKPLFYFRKSGLYNGRQTIIASLEQNTNLIGQPTLALFRKSAAQRGFDARFIGHLDFEFWCHLLEQGDFFYLDEVMATWRVHDDQQTAQNMKTKSSGHEQLLLMETYFAKPWLQEQATDRMLFTQIYYLRKSYGSEALSLTSAMQSRLSNSRFAWQWLKHKAGRPLQKLSRRLSG